MKASISILIGIVTIGICSGFLKQKEWKIIEQTREVPALGTWDREFNASRAGHFRIQVSGEPPFRVSLVDDALYQQMVKEKKNAPSEKNRRGQTQNIKIKTQKKGGIPGFYI